MLKEKVVSNITRGCYSADEISFEELLSIVKQSGNALDLAMLALIASEEQKIEIAEIILAN